MTTPKPDLFHGWHFLRADHRLGHGDNREVHVREALTVDGPLEICRSGLHASPRALDAFNYAPGPIACRVTLSGTIIRGTGDNADKACATRRTVTAMIDMSVIAEGFIRDTLVYRQPALVSLFAAANLPTHTRAIADLDMASAPWDAIKSTLAASRDAARDAAAWDAAGDATWDAAWDAAWATAWATAWAAAARDAAWDAARDAAWDDLNALFEARLNAAMGVPA